MTKFVAQSLEVVLMVSIANAWGKTEITHPKIHPVYVKSGDTLELICEHDDPFSLQWYRDSVIDNLRQYIKIDTSSESGFYMTSQVKDGRGWTNLTKSNVTVSDAGSYRCSLVSKPDRAHTVDVIVLLANEISGLLSRNSSSANIGCTVASVTSNQIVRVAINWFKDGKPVISDGTHYTITNMRSDLKTMSFINISKIGDKDIGAYHCVMSLGNGVNLTQVVNVMSNPQVKSMGRSRNLVVGTTLELECRVSGWPLPRVTWQKMRNNERIPLDFSDKRLSLQPGVAVAPHGLAIENATLVITNITYEDRDTYVCDIAGYVDGAWHVDNGTVLVRVKGKFAAVWPLLGILLEAVILVIIIIVHETSRARKRSKEEEDSKDLMSSNHLENSNAQRSGSAGHETMRLRKNC